MGPFLVVVLDPVADGLSRFREGAEVVLPYALFLQAAEEALNDAVLLRGVGGDELLGEAVVAEGRSEPAAHRR